MLLVLHSYTGVVPGYFSGSIPIETDMRAVLGWPTKFVLLVVSLPLSIAQQSGLDECSSMLASAVYARLHSLSFEPGPQYSQFISALCSLPVDPTGRIALPLDRNASSAFDVAASVVHGWHALVEYPGDYDVSPQWGPECMVFPHQPLSAELHLS